ncbi:MAG: hypothetical protein QM308_06535 [Bacillota bacterium]|nr:hypothetical protein [Bacillota bacterium]
MKRKSALLTVAVFISLLVLSAMGGVLHAEAQPAVTHTCAFYGVDGQLIRSVQVADGEKLAPVNAPGVEGMRFSHWYQVNASLQGSPGSGYSFSSPVTEAVYLKAFYEPLPEATPSLAPEATTDPMTETQNAETSETEVPEGKEPAAEETVSEEVVTEEPAAEEPVAEESATEGPVPEEVVTEEPAAEEPVAEEPATEEPVSEEAVTEEPAAEEPVAEEPEAEEPVSEEVVTEEPAAGEPVAEEPATEEPVSEEVVMEEPAAEESEMEGPAEEEPAIEETSVEGSAADQSSAFLKEEIDAMYPNRKITFYATWGNKPAPEIGDEITIHARLSGYEGLEYVIRWQVKHTGHEDWKDVGITGEVCTLTLTQENLDWVFRVAVDITDVE